MGIGNFRLEDIQAMQQHRKALEQLKGLGNVWIGQDVALEKKVVAPPSLVIRHANIVLNKKDLPAIEINRGALSELSWSVRSFLAQSGIEIRFHHSNLSDAMIRDINEGKNVSVPIDITNHGQRAVELEGEVMRFFWVDFSKHLRGEELAEALKSKFVIDGEEGKDYFLAGRDWDENFETLKTKPTEGMCVIVRLQEQRFYIPYKPEPVKIRNRKELPEVLEEIPKGPKINFEIGQTPKIKVGQDIVAVINTGAYEHGRMHILSPLILGGEVTGSEGHVRTEILNQNEEAPAYVEFNLYRK